MKKLLAKKYWIKSLIFFLEQWNIGILNFSIQEILQKKAEIKWLPNPIKSIFYPDPFGFEIDGKKMIIFEDYSKILRIWRIYFASKKSSEKWSYFVTPSRNNVWARRKNLSSYSKLFKFLSWFYCNKLRYRTLAKKISANNLWKK